MHRPQTNYGNYYDEYEEDALLEEEFDPNFEPTPEEIRVYAVNNLHMDLPEDNMLLYLAKEALKKPLPNTWEAYQRPNGDYYYKHKHTQERLTEHPVDVEYRKLYEQEKEKIARRTLKSKTSKPAGLTAMKLLGNIAKEEEFSSYATSGITSNQPSHLTQNMSAASEPNEAELAQQVEEELKRYEAGLARVYEQFQHREERDLAERERRLRDSHQDELDRISRNSQLPVSFDERVRQEKEALRKQYEQQQQQIFKRELRDEEERLRAETVRNEKDLQQEWQLKMKDVQQRNNQKLESKAALLERMREDLQQEKREKEEKQRLDVKRAREEFDRNREQFSRDADNQLQLELQKLARERQDRLRQRKHELENEYQRIRRLLKSAPEDKLKELIERKSRLQDLSDKKYESHRAKELQLIERNFKAQTEQKKQQLREKLEHSFQLAELQLAGKLEDKLKQELSERTSHIADKLKDKEKQIFGRFQEKLQQYQLNRNKKLISARQNFIQEIENTKDKLEKEYSLQSAKLLARQKEFELANREKIVKALRNDIKQGERELRKHELDRKLYRLADQKEITEALKAFLSDIKQQKHEKAAPTGPEASLSQLPLQNQLSSVFQEHQARLEQLQKTLVYDKALLAKVAHHLQSTSMLPFHDRHKIMRSDLPTDMQLTKLQSISAGKNELIKKYNADIRKLRENEKAIMQLEQLLKRADYDEEGALLELRSFKVHYDEPILRSELQQSPDLASQLHHMKNNISPAKFPSPVDADLLSTKRVQNLFEDHSRFLTNIKQELNSRLWEIRGMAGYGSYRPF